ncbi:MAG: hypothetical protein ACYSWQ_27635 [Planctomycetota bacterium]
MKNAGIRAALLFSILSLIAGATLTAAEFGYPSDLSLEAVRERIDGVGVWLKQS